MRQVLRKTRRRVDGVRPHSSSPEPPRHGAPRTSIVMTRRAALGAAWVATVALAAFAGWIVGQRFWPPPQTRPSASAEPREPSETTLPRYFEEIRPVAPAPAVKPLLDEVELSESLAVEPASRPVSPPPETEAPSDIAVEVPVAEPPAPIEPAAPPAPVVVVTEGFEHAAALADRGDYDGARAEAETLLAEYGDYSGLIDAFRESGVDETRARLQSLRVLQLGGLHMIAVELARELKRSYAGSAEVLAAIHDWRILKPSVAGLDTSIEEGRRIVARGRVSNPDIGVVRRVMVEVEALDAGGNVLATTTARVRPKSLDSGAAGSFTAEFAVLDPASVLRVRATVVEWQSEVLDR